MGNLNGVQMNLFYSTWNISICYLIGAFVALTKHHMEVMYGCMQMMLKGITWPVGHIGIDLINY